MDVPAAEYPTEELLKYNIGLAPASKTTSKDLGITGSTKTTASTVLERGQVVKIRRRAPKTKLRVQAANSNASTRLRRHITERSWTIRNWYKHLHWKNTTIIIIPTIGVLSLFGNIKLTRPTFLFTVLNYFITLMSINMLYHRYWSHHSFNIENEKVVYGLATLSSGGGITSAKNWCASHRAHHRYCDTTDQDPHNVRKGFLFSHVGWMILIHNPKMAKTVKESKLDQLPNEAVVKWQLENYFSLFILVGLVLPSVICGWFWNDYLGGLFYAGFLKTFLVQNAVFLVNSLGHTVGTQPYNDTKSPRDNLLLSLLTLGEGNQNFHHEFPMDYRNGYEWYDFDPVKWIIRSLELFGVVTDVKRASSSTIAKSYVQQQQKLIDSKRSQLNWGIPIERLPVFSPKEFKRLADNSKDRYIVVVSGIIHDITPFAKDHPGGLPLIKASHGKDCTTAFNGAVYQHSNAARNLLATMRIGVLDGSEDLFWKQQRIENKAVPIDNDADGNRIVRSGSQATTFNTVIGGTAGAA